MPNPNQPGSKEGEESGRMSFFEHLAELRTRLIHVAVSILIGAFVGFAVAKPVLAFIARPMVAALKGAGLQDKLIFTHPAGYLNLVLTTGLYLGVVLASPYVLYQIWLFVAPGLYKHERKAIAAFIAPTAGLFRGSPSRTTSFCRICSNFWSAFRVTGRFNRSSASKNISIWF